MVGMGGTVGGGSWRSRSASGSRESDHAVQIHGLSSGAGSPIGTAGGRSRRGSDGSTRSSAVSLLERDASRDLYYTF